MELVVKILPESRVLGTQYWITVLFVVCLVLLAWVRTAYPKKIPLLFKEVFTGEIPLKEKSITPPSVVLFVVFLCCTTLLTIKALPFFVKKSFDNQAEGFLTIGGALLLFYLAKTVVLLVIGIIFDEQSAAWEYISEIYVFAHLIAIVLLPFVAVMFYTYGIDHKAFGEVVLIIVGALMVWRTIKMFILMTNKGLRVMYLFLYICGLEIVPIALFIKYGLMNHLK